MKIVIWRARSRIGHVWRWSVLHRSHYRWGFADTWRDALDIACAKAKAIIKDET